MLIAVLLIYTTALAKSVPKTACNPPIDGCSTCETPSGGEQTCTSCTGGQKVQPNGKGCIAECPDNATEESGICKCLATHQPSDNGLTCVPKTACNPPIDGCSTCETPSGGEQTCTSCTGGQKVQPNGKGCIAECPDNATEESGICKCLATHQPSDNGLTCVPKTACNTPNCKTCDNPKTDREVCTECNDGNYLTPTNQCVPDCTAIGGYYGDSADKKCKKCNSECAECVGPASNQCSACPAGRALTYSDGSHPGNGGSCGDACAADKNGCKVCGARIGGTDYCSHCSDNAQAPLNGNCATNSARVAFCAAMGAGVCTKCAANYFLQDGGCYEATKQPGKQICTLATSDGKCQTCANSLQPNDGVCPSCHPTYKTCRDTDTANACTTCATGYYMVGSAAGACTSCEADSGSVKGVSGCLSCAPPSGDTGSVLCYLTKDDGTGGSTNKSGLTTGAIAGIAVAVVIVVGGLVGFLCWWFLCRGKA